MLLKLISSAFPFHFLIAATGKFSYVCDSTSTSIGRCWSRQLESSSLCWVKYSLFQPPDWFCLCKQSTWQSSIWRWSSTPAPFSSHFDVPLPPSPPPPAHHKHSSQDMLKITYPSNDKLTVTALLGNVSHKPGWLHGALPGMATLILWGCKTSGHLSVVDCSSEFNAREQVMFFITLGEKQTFHM